MKKIQLTQGKHALVDDRDFDYLSQWVWTLMARPYCVGYAYRKQDRRSVLMHREIMKPPAGMWIDHLNRNGLDNRRKNLRLCTPKQNARYSLMKSRAGKSSRFKGVHYCRTTGRWIARIMTDEGKMIARYFANERAAAAQWNEWATEMHGEWAVLNDL